MKADSQKAMIVHKLATLKHGSNRFSKVEGEKSPSTKTPDHDDAPPASIEQAAERVGVDRATVAVAKKVSRTAPPAVVRLVERGDISLTGAQRGSVSR